MVIVAGPGHFDGSYLPWILANSIMSENRKAPEVGPPKVAPSQNTGKL